MQIKDWFIHFLDGIRDFFEHASPSVFSVLAAVLPYASPLPIAAITANSAEGYLGMTNTIAGIFVFVLEGLGLWVTSAFVDAVVDYIKSRNWKSAIMVVLLLIIVVVYISILVNLNVRLKLASGNITQEYSTIITLICFLPLISGFMNGYWKLRLQARSDIERAVSAKEDKDERIRQEQRQDRMAMYKIRHGINPDAVVYPVEEPIVSEKKQKFASNFHDQILNFLVENYQKTGKVARVVDISAKFKLDYNKSKGYISGLRKDWMNQNQIDEV